MSDANDRKDDTTPKKGGFGAFADKYRDRWTADHPKPARPGTDAAPASPAPDAPPAPSDPAPKQ